MKIAVPIVTAREDLIQPGQEITIQTQNGQHSFIVANGYLNEGFRAGGGNERGTAPDLYISQTALKELFPQYRVFRVAFDTDGQHDESILQELKQITASQANIDIISRYERREEMQEYLITAKVLGTSSMRTIRSARRAMSSLWVTLSDSHKLLFHNFI